VTKYNRDNHIKRLSHLETKYQMSVKLSHQQ